MSSPQLPPGYPPPYNPVAWAQALVQVRDCTLENNQKLVLECKYQGTPTTGQVTWTCPAGSFCLGQDYVRPCTPGFYCPANTAVAGYCPKGYMCSNDTTKIVLCPKGSFCPIGTVWKDNTGKSGGLHCLDYCPEGTGAVSKFGIGGAFLVIVAIIWAFFNWKEKADKEMSLKRSRELTAANQHLLEDKPVLSRLSKTFDIEFDNLGLVLPNGVEIMGRVTGSLKSGRACAIMGPSGAGKTTFVTLLTGKVKRTSGTVTLNGQKDELSKYSKLIGYVPQEDIMLRELTVRDILMHSARMRLPRDWEYRKVKAKVLEIISFLGLSHVAQTVIGDEETRGISGGQRKRVNIGMELVAEPSVLFLDEPTSGLDSSTSYEVCANLRQIAEQQGLTVAAVIHSPSPATFKQFHDFMLLGKGGHVVYIGPREGCVEYFKKIGFTCPADESPSDFFMDVVTGKVACEFEPAFVPKDLFEYWEQHMQGRNPFEGRRRMTPEEAAHARKVHARQNAPEKIPELGIETPTKKKASNYYGWTDYIASGAAALLREWGAFAWDVATELYYWIKSIVLGIFQKDDVREVQPFYMQLWLLMKRAILQVYKNAGSVLSEMILHFCAGLFISIAIQNFGFLGKNPDDQCAYVPINIIWFCQGTVDNLGNAGMFICLGVLFAGVSVGANTFGRERVVYWRDAASGMSAIPYFLAKFIVDIPRIILGSTFYFLALIILFPYYQSLGYLYTVVVLLYFVSFAMGYWISTAFPLSRAALIGTGFALLWALVLSGVVPKLSEVKDSANPYPAVFAWLWDASAPRWAIEAFWLKEVEARPWKEKNETPANAYVKDNYYVDLKNIVLIAITWCVLAFLGLKLFNRSKQK
ncbi:hypothetical protein EDD86DRAFT_277572 [Gorgonomyces haynaldii]|nr:hypothetical protein EDD86DRAFT_277572 [Gorgonomyces haynaldii]